MNEIIFTIFILMIIMYLLWRLISDEITYSHRMKILDYKRKYININDIDTYYKYDKDYESVTYEQHQNAVFTFRNPWKLYRYGDEYKNAVDK